MVASWGAACAAGFLWTKARASRHARSAVGYALLSWAQSVLMTLMVAAQPWGCRYGILPANRENIYNLNFGKVHWAFMHPLEILFWFRMLFYVGALLWMQWLIERRFHALEKTSGRKWGGHKLAILLRIQAWCIGVAMFILGPAVALLEAPDTVVKGWVLFIFMVLAWGLGGIFLLANLLGASIALWALFGSVYDLRCALQEQRLQHTPQDVAASLRDALRLNQWQAIAVSCSLLLSIALSPAVCWQVHTQHTLSFSWDLKRVSYPTDHLASVLCGITVQFFDVLGNALAVVLLSGTHRVTESASVGLWIPSRRCCSGSTQTERSETWRKTVEELSTRGLTLNSLMKFYEEDLCYVHGTYWSYVPEKHKTRDVVRRVIIPLTAGQRCAYATSSYNRDGPKTPKIMVTHNWGNHFKDLLAAIVAHALQECSFQTAAKMLRDPVFLRGLLQENGRLNDVYWVCAFSVNQHVSICNKNESDWDPIFMSLHPTCSCPCDPIRDPDKSEMNKFDDMMRHLADNGGCEHLIAVDQSLDLFNRAWCIAEIAEARRLGMRQSLKLISNRVLLRRERSLRNLDIARMKCADSSDKTMILEKIEQYISVERFNEQLRFLIFDERSGWLKLSKGFRRDP
ncbi:BMY1 [Symbiodinium sp. CCMP2456]|nr:BMY1 [Symbiodinium sp. CCMP2456]